MKRVFLIIAIVTFNLSLFSCSTSDLSEEISVEEMATEGEDGNLEEESSEEGEGN